jgi:ESX secretion system protein EccE
VSAVREHPAAVPRGAPAPRQRQADRPPSRSTPGMTRTYPGRHLGPVPVATIVAWQAALGILAAGVAYGGILRFVGAFAVLLVAALTVLWWNGRPLWRWMRVWLAYRSRAARATVGPPHDPALAPIREWLPGFELASVAGRRGGRTVGVAHDGSGYIVLLGPDREDLIASADPVHIPLRALASLGEAEGVRLASAQLVIRMLPAPAPTLGPYGAQLGASYAEISGGATPSVMSWWVALRLEPARDGTSVTLDGRDHDAIRRALRASVGWATKVLSSSGLPCRPLEESELREVLTLTLNVDPQRAPASRRERRTAETWRGWNCDGVAHVAGWVRSWPKAGMPALTNVLGGVSGLPLLAATASLSFTWSPENTVRCSSFVRVSAGDPKTARGAFRQLARHSGRARVSLVRLDGEQFPGILATTPLGGGAV